MFSDVAPQVKGYSITVNLKDEASQKAAPWVSLLDDKGSLLSTSGTLQDQGSSLTTWSRTSAGKYQYTTTPTPGKANIFT